MACLWAAWRPTLRPARAATAVGSPRWAAAVFPKPAGLICPQQSRPCPLLPQWITPSAGAVKPHPLTASTRGTTRGEPHPSHTASQSRPAQTTRPCPPNRSSAAHRGSTPSPDTDWRPGKCPSCRTSALATPSSSGISHETYKLWLWVLWRKAGLLFIDAVLFFVLPKMEYNCFYFCFYCSGSCLVGMCFKKKNRPFYVCRCTAVLFFSLSLLYFFFGGWPFTPLNRVWFNSNSAQLSGSAELELTRGYKSWHINIHSWLMIQMYKNSHEEIRIII